MQFILTVSYKSLTIYPFLSGFTPKIWVRFFTYAICVAFPAYRISYTDQLKT